MYKFWFTNFLIVIFIEKCLCCSGHPKFYIKPVYILFMGKGFMSADGPST